jgi:hypothetical protein
MPRIPTHQIEFSTRRRRCIARGSTGLERGKGYLAQLSAAAAEGMETSRRTEGEEFGWWREKSRGFGEVVASWRMGIGE